MSLSIRLQRVGTTKKARWRFVVQPTLSKRDGRFIELLGHYNPTLDPAEVVVKKDRIQYWVDQGAKASLSVKNLLARQGLKVPVRR